MAAFVKKKKKRRREGKKKNTTKSEKLFRPVSEETAGAVGWHRAAGAARPLSAQPDGGTGSPGPARRPFAPRLHSASRAGSSPAPGREGWPKPQRREPVQETPTCRKLRRHRGTSEGQESGSTAPGPQHFRGALGAPAPLDEPTAKRERPPRNGSGNGAPRHRDPDGRPETQRHLQVTEGTFS